MIVKNEEKHLARCLESVKDVVDEIVIVDTGSTDTTLAIAEKYSAKIFHFEWQNNFAVARNKALEHSSGDWILYLDADEQLTEQSKRELRTLTKQKKREAYKCVIKNIDEINNHPSVMTYVRLFPNHPAIRFEGSVHEQIESCLRRNNYKIKDCSVTINHYGYNLPKDALQKKAKRNLELLLQEYSKTPSSYNAFQIGQTYGVLDEKSGAEEYFTTALQDHAMSKEYRSIAYRYLAINHAERQQVSAARELIDKSLACDMEQPLALMAASKIYLRLGDAAKAEMYCKKAFAVNSDFLKGRKKSHENILISEVNICYHGLEVALRSNKKELFNFFYQTLLALTSNRKSGELELFEHLLNNKQIEVEHLPRLGSAITESNMDLIFLLFPNYHYPQIKLGLLNSVNGNFKNNAEYLNTLGALYAEINDHTAAIAFYERSQAIHPDNPSALFYLVSEYLQAGLVEKILTVVNNAEIRFAGNETVLSHLNLLKQKLPQLFN